MHIRYIILLVLLLSILSCQNIPQTPVIKTTSPVVTPDITAQVETTNQRDRVVFHVKLGHLNRTLPINAQALNQTQIQFLRLWVKGQGISGSIFNSKGFVNVAGNPAATLSIDEVPRGTNRIVTVQAYDANQQVIPGAQLKGYYSSSANSLVTVFLNWRFFPTADILEKLLASNPTLSQSLSPTDLQTVIDTLTYGANPVGGPTFDVHPSRLDTSVIETYLLNNGAPPSPNNIPPNWSTGLNTSGQLTGLTIGSNIVLKLLDPATQTLNIVAGAATENFALNNSTPGNWPLNITITSTTSSSTGIINPVAAGVNNIVATVPTISSFTPPGGTAGTVVTITGTNFTGTTDVSFNGITATGFTVDNANQISATVPAGNIAGPIVVTSPNGTVTTVQNMTIGNIIFVDIDAVGANNGSSWANAFTTLQAGLAAATNGDQIWVSDGTYRITGARTNTFQLVTGTSLFGGFNATETLLTQRNIGANVAILSGDINNDDVPPFGNNADNAHHVVTGANSALIDGFTIRGGNADGGGMNSDGGGMLNNATSPSVRNMTFLNNSADSDGGGMANFASANPTVSDSTFNVNRSTGDDGGGMFSDTSSPIVTTVTFTGNTTGGGAQNNGGGMYFIRPSTAIIDGCTFTNNTAADNGGGIFIFDNSTVTLRNTTFSNNTANDDGGAIGLDTNANAIMDNVTMNNNNATNDGGGLFVVASNPTLTNSNINNNTSGGNGGGIYMDSSTGNISSTTVDSNTANNGGGVYNTSGSSTTYTTMTITNNNANPDGGGVYNSTSNITITNSNINTNSSVDDGGGMYNLTSNPTITTVTFNGNTTTGAGTSADGAGMYNNGSNPNITGSTFTNNITVDDGGGMFNLNSAPVINNCTFTSNQATTAGEGAGADGGGMYNNASNAVITNSTFTNNTAADDGGGAYNFGVSTPSFTDTTFTTNGAADNGGGFYNATGTDATLTRVTLTGNTSTMDGAGMFVTGATSQPVVNQCVFNANIAGDDGGGIYITSTSGPTINNSLFIGNQANGVAGQGGGIRVFSTATPTIFNSTLINNTAVDGGGGIGINNASPTLANLILWNNTAPVGNGLQIRHVSGTLTLSFLTIQGDIAGINGGGTITNNGNNLATDPLFVNIADSDGADNIFRTSDDGLRLQGTSPALNSGTNIGAPATDLIGTARPQGGTTDRGAYEQ